MLAPGTLLQGRYLVMKPIGEGGMGAVHLAVDQRLGSNVALKATFHTADERLRAAFEREARLLAGLHHPALPRVTDYFIENNGQFLVMEYIAGQDLSEMLLARRGVAFPVGDVLAWADQLLDALDYLHTQASPVIHRDIKPANLKLTARGQIILLDFGLAKDTTAPKVAADTNKTVLGYSLNYAPLEQLQGQGTGPRSDLYSLGATLYQLLTGTPPIDVLNRLNTVAAGEPDPLRQAHELNPDVPPAIAAVIHHAMAINREQRPASAATLRRLLKEAHAPLPPPPVIDSFSTTVRIPRAGQAGPSLPAPRNAAEAQSGAAASEPTGMVPDSAMEGSQTPGGEAHSLPPAQSPHAAAAAAAAAVGQTHRARTAQDFKTVPSIHVDPSTVPHPEATRKTGPFIWLLLGAAGVLAVTALAIGSYLFFSAPAAVRSERPVRPPAPLPPSPSPTPSPARPPAPPTGTLVKEVTAPSAVNEVAAGSAAAGAELMVATVGNENKVLLWSAGDGRLLRELEGHTKPGRSVAISPDTQVVASGSDDGTLRLWRATDGSLLTSLSEHTRQVFIVGFSPDGKKLLSASGDKTVLVIDLGENRILHKLTLAPEDTILAISPGGTAVAVSSADEGSVRLVSVADTNVRQTLEGEAGTVTCKGSFSSDGQYLALGSADGAVRVWRTSDGRLVSTQQGPEGEVGSVVISPDGRLIAAGWSDGSIGLWRMREVAQRTTLEGHAEMVWSLAFSGAGRVLVSGSDAKTVRVWQVNEEGQ